MNKKILSLFITAMLCDGFSYANATPVGFESLNETSRIRTRVEVNDDSYLEVWTDMSYNTATLAPADKQTLQAFLCREYLTGPAIQLVTENLLAGISSSAACRGLRETCQIEEGDEDDGTAIQYVVVQDKALVRVMVPASGMSARSHDREFIDDTVDQNAVLMHHRLNVNGGADTDITALYRNAFTAGVLGGYVRSDLNLTSNNDGNANNQYLYFDELGYNYLTGDHRVRAGYLSDSVTRSWNSTALLDGDERISALSLDFGTTRELEYRSAATAPRLYFSVPTSGRLIVTRSDGTLVLEKNVSAGQNYLSYSKLPTGIETLELRVMAGQTELYRELRKIYNNGDYRLKAGDYDFQVSVGRLDDQDESDNAIVNNRVELYQDNAFIDGRIATQLGDNWTFGVELLNTREDYQAKVAAEYVFNDNLSVQALHGQFNDDSRYSQMSLNIFGVNIDWSQFADRQGVDDVGTTSLANYLYGYGSYEDLTVAYDHRLGDGNAYFNYSNYKSQGLEAFYQLYDDDEQFYRYQSFVAGYAFRGIWNSTIDISTTYTYSEDVSGADDDRLEFALNWTVPIGTTSYASYAGVVSEDNQYHRAALSNRYAPTDDLSLTAEAGLRYSDASSGMPSETIADASLSASYRDRNVSGSAYGYIDSDQGRSTYADLSASTLFVGGDVYTTPDEADSYLIISNAQQDSASIDASGDKFLSVATLRGNGSRAGRLTLDEDQVIYPIKPYQEYQVTLDEAASDYHNRGESTVRGSSYPGTALTLDVDMKEVKSYISVFNDIEGRPVSEVVCKGSGCLGVEELTEGVFKFKVSQGEPFVLQSKNQRCLIPAPSEFAHQNLGTNFCMPVFDMQDGMQMAQGENGRFYYYIGEFANNTIIERYLNQSDTDLTLIRKQVGERLFLFAESPDLMARQQVDTLEALGAYALEEQENIPYVSR